MPRRTAFDATHDASHFSGHGYAFRKSAWCWSGAVGRCEPQRLGRPNNRAMALWVNPVRQRHQLLDGRQFVEQLIVWCG